jgi:integrase
MGSRRDNGEGTWGYSEARGAFYWAGRIRLRDGTTTRKWIYRKKQGDLKKAVRELKKKVESGAPLKRSTLKDFLTYWLDDVIDKTKEPETAQRYRITVEKHILPHLGNVAMDDLSVEHVQRWLTTLTEKGLAPATVRKYKESFGYAMKRAVAERRIQWNPVEHAETVKGKSAERNPWSADETRAFLTASRPSRCWIAYVVAAHTGLRVSEICTLKWDHIDFEKGLVNVPGTKTEASANVLPLPRPVSEALKARKAMQQPPSPYVLPNAKGKPLAPETVSHEFVRDVRSAGLRQITFHDLRHGAATLLHGAGVHPEVIQKVLRHKTRRMTAHYTHFDIERMREALSLLDGKLL